MTNCASDRGGFRLGTILSVILFLLASSAVHAYVGPPPGGWIPVPSYAVARYGHTAVTLKDGMVLLVGGYDQAGNLLATAELYDPDREMITRIPDMVVPRGNPAAALLQSGRVLIIGGRSGHPEWAEQFDPTTHMFTPLPTLSVPRAEGTTATALSDGTVLIAGGDSAQSVLEVFDGTVFRNAGLSPFLLRSPSVTALSTNLVVIAGGDNVSQAGIFSGVGVTQITGFMQPRGPFPAFSATPIANGRILFAGGRPVANGPDLGTLELFDSSTRTIQPVSGGSFAPRSYHSATLLPSGKVMFQGGDAIGMSVQTFDPASLTFSNETPLPRPSARHAGVTLATGDPAIFGGAPPNSSYTFGDIFRFGTAEGGFKKVLNSFPPYTGGVALLHDGRLLIVTGGTIQAVDPYFGYSTGVLGYLPNSGGFTTTVLEDGRVLFAGGNSNGASAWILDPVSLTLTPTGSMTYARSGHVARLLPSGKVLVAGGISSPIPVFVELYDPASGRWTPGPPMMAPRAGSDFSAILDVDGILLTGGGYPGAESYLPGPGTLVPYSPLWYLNPIWPNPERTSDIWSAATLTAEGKVLHAGGKYSSFIPPPPFFSPITGSAALWDLARNTDTSIGPLRIPRAHHAALTLMNGDVLVLGGLDVNYAPVATAELHENRSLAPFISSVFPGHSVSGGVISLRGGAICGNSPTVSINGVPSAVISCGLGPYGDNVTLQVPAGATSGPIVIRTLGGSSDGYPFEVDVPADLTVPAHIMTGFSSPGPGLSQPSQGSAVNYSATITNLGPGIGKEAVATITSSEPIIGIYITNGICPPIFSDNVFTVACTLGNLASGASVQAQYGVAVNTAGPATLNTSVSVSSKAPDPVVGNNRSDMAVPIINIPPVIDYMAAGPSSGTAPLPVTFNAFAHDYDGQIVSYEWTFGDNSAPVVTSIPTVTHTYAAPGNYVALVKATDNRGGIGVDNVRGIAYVNVIGPPPNLPPVIDSLSASPSSGDVPLPVTFNAVAHDVDGQVVSYEWTFGDNSAPVVTTVPTVSHTYSYPGSFTTSVKATDNRGGVGLDNVRGIATVTVTAANIPPVVDSLSDSPSSGDAPLPVTFNAVAHDVDGQIVSYEWTFGDNSAPVVTSAPTVSHTYAAPGSYIARLKITDNQGGIGLDNVRGVVAVTVTVPNIPPVVDSLSASPPSGDAPLPVTFNAFAHDVDGQVVSYTWTFGDNSAPVVTTVPTVSHTYSYPGSFTTSVKATDNRGGVGLDNVRGIATVTVTAPNILPIVNAMIATPIYGEAPLAVTLNVGGAYDPDGQIVSYDWTFGDGSPTVRTTIPTVTHTYVTSKSYLPTVMVTDNRGGTAVLDSSKQLQVIVTSSAPPVSTIASPAGGATLRGESFTITGTAADDGSGVRLVEVSINGGSWIAATGMTNWSYAWSLPSTGTFTIRSRCTDNSGHVETPGTGVTVSVDNIPPVGTVVINSAAAYTKTASVTLTLSATDAGGVVQMMFSNDNATWTAAESYKATKSWTLTSGDGTKSVYASFKDTVGNWSPACKASIVLDTKAPAVTVTDPANNATGVPVAKVLSITFSENVQAGATYGSITLKRGGASVTFTKAIIGGVITLKPGASMAKNTKYTLTVPAGAFQDMAGNPLASDKTFSFTTSK